MPGAGEVVPEPGGDIDPPAAAAAKGDTTAAAPPSAATAMPRGEATAEAEGPRGGLRVSARMIAKYSLQVAVGGSRVVAVEERASGWVGTRNCE